MTNRRVLPFLSLVTFLAACGGASRDELRRGGAPEPAADAAAPTGGMRVALLSPGPISDAGWNAAAYAGLLEIRDELGAEVAQVETRTPPEFEAGFREYAALGYDLVFGHGFEFQDAAAKVGADYPGTVFITSSGSTVHANQAPMVFRLEQATYLLGMLAARMAPGGKVGVVGGLEIPSVASTFLAFEAGVHAVAPEMPVLQAYLGSWDDVSAAKEAALAQIGSGAKFILHNADAAGLGVLRAVAEARAGGADVYAFVSNADQAGAAPTAVLASAVLDIPQAFVAVAREVQAGTFQGRVLELGIADGIVSLVWNPALASAVPPEVVSELREVEARIRAGELEVPVGY